MILAELHGKVPESVYGSEDVLTSYVFGVLETLPPERLLVPWLRRATRLDGSGLTTPPVISALVQAWPNAHATGVNAASGARCNHDTQGAGRGNHSGGRGG